MKKTLLFGLLLAIASAAAFAGGSKDQGDDWSSRRDQWREDAEEISLTGSLVLEDSRFTGLESDGEVYWLMYPRYAVDELELQEGDEITIEGFIMPGPRRGDSDEQFIRVEKAIIDGEEYDVSEYIDEYGHGPMHGPRMPGKRGWDDETGPRRGGRI